jgi:hypothetical protein
MSKTVITKCHGEIEFYARTHQGTVEYLSSVGPALVGKKGAIEVFIQSLVTLLVARHEWFLGMILVVGVRERKDHWRDYLVSREANPAQKERLVSADLKTLIHEAKKTVGMKRQGAAFARVFAELFGFSPWPSDATHSAFLDLNLLRQLFVHHNAASLGDEYRSQFSRKELLGTQQYGDLPPIHFVDYHECLGFLPEAVRSLEAQRLHMKAEMLARPEWLVRN